MSLRAPRAWPDPPVPRRRAPIGDRPRLRGAHQPRRSGRGRRTRPGADFVQPAGNRSLPRRDALPLVEAYLDGALSLDGPFGVWGAIALDRADEANVDRALDRGCVGISLPAGSLSSVAAISRRRTVLARLRERDAPLFIHPGPGPGPTGRRGGGGLAGGSSLVAGSDSLRSPDAAGLVCISECRPITLSRAARGLRDAPRPPHRCSSSDSPAAGTGGRSSRSARLLRHVLIWSDGRA